MVASHRDVLQEIHKALSSVRLEFVGGINEFLHILHARLRVVRIFRPEHFTVARIFIDIPDDIVHISVSGSFPEPLDLFVEGGALLWGLLYNFALMNFAFPGQYLAFFYPLERLQQVIDYVRRVEPASLPRDNFSLTGDADWGKARGMVLLRRKGDGHHVLAVIYETGVRVLTCLGRFPEPAS